jgi:hypothetical protein
VLPPAPLAAVVTGGALLPPPAPALAPLVCVTTGEAPEPVLLGGAEAAPLVEMVTGLEEDGEEGTEPLEEEPVVALP